jgi:selenocysteine-specific elongation factor
MPGFGTVVTGTLVGGRLPQGAEVVLLPSARRARIRGLQQHNSAVQQAHPGTRTAVNLSGIDHMQVERGDVLTIAGSLTPSRRLDARLTILPSATQPIGHRQRLLMYHGTAERMVEVSLLDSDELLPGREGLAQLFAAEPIPAVDGDRFILRRPSPAETVAGGVILDIAPRRHRRRDATVLSALRRRLDGDVSTRAVVELQKHPFGLSREHLAARLSVDETTLDSLIPSPQLQRVGETWITAGQWARIAARIHDGLEAYHRAQPLRKGMPREELRSKAALPAQLYPAAIARLIDEAVVVERGTDLALASHKPGLTPEQALAISRFLAELALKPFNPPPLAELMQRHQVTPALVQYLVAEQRIVRVSDDTVFIRSAYDEALNRLRTHLEAHRTLTVAAARDVLGSSRRYVLPLLQWLDAQKITRRVGDDRILRG